ncbi:DUF6131 family protein [Microtetraspora sp. AC03309]|uniref:DUF6131 family protein n=1 Tax=Microtetraspora sp. AC03309 TaxID=2779376 RepID=UPI0027E0E7DB|nr:DUF6131 family protein [Microtetraspora sp. AC03309]
MRRETRSRRPERHLREAPGYCPSAGRRVDGNGQDRGRAFAGTSSRPRSVRCERAGEVHAEVSGMRFGAVRRHIWRPDGQTDVTPPPGRSEGSMIVLGIILLILGFALGIYVLWAIGIVLLVIGVVLWILGALGHAVGGRRHYW